MTTTKKETVRGKNRFLFFSSHLKWHLINAFISNCNSKIDKINGLRVRKRDVLDKLKRDETRRDQTEPKAKKKEIEKRSARKWITFIRLVNVHTMFHLRFSSYSISVTKTEIKQ